MGFVLVMLAIDLRVFHKQAHEVSMKEAGAWSAIRRAGYRSATAERANTAGGQFGC